MKSIIILISAVLLTGCSVEYDLEFNDTELKEKIVIGKFEANKIEGFGELTPYSISNDEIQEYYEFDYLNESLYLDYTYDLNRFEISNPFNECYELSNFSYDDNYYYILTSNEFKCLNYMEYEAEEVKINFKSNHKIINSNADYINNNVHTWIVNKNNMKNKPIEIKIEKEYIEETNNIQKEEINNIFLLITLIVIIVIVILFISLKIKSKKADII